MFKNQRGNSGVGGLVGVVGVLAAWVALGAVMWTSYATPQVRESDRCQLVCRPSVVHSQG